MPLFVPILRLLMLFLNVYDSYKNLKLPPPSSRNAGQPSLRAMTQRKRDMKGILAVWIVWVSLTMYERTLESIICLLVPFYNEFKSLALLFLILTRARGAEPIYLHLIRPLVKPYTSTLDNILDLMLMIGDFIFALSMYPIHIGLEWWHRLHAGKSDGFATAQESTSSEYSSEADISDAPSSLIESSNFPTSSNGRPTPRKSTSKTSTRKSSTNSIPSAEFPLPQEEPQAKGASNILDPSPPTASSSRVPQRSKPRDESNHPDMEPNQFAPLKHQIWHPPKNTSDDDEDFMQTEILKREQAHLDEWRQYPPFPSAYPPTPLAVTSTLVATSLPTYPPIQEEPARQDFRQSLLPPREPLNPSPAAGTSDVNIHTPGNSPFIYKNGAHSDNSDEEDQFNITLQTPLLITRTLRSQTRPQRPISILSEPSITSIGSRTSALTTSDIGSPLQTHQSPSDSSRSGPKPTESIPVIGKKRAFPRNDSYNAPNRVREIEESALDDTTDNDSVQMASTTNRKVSQRANILNAESSLSSGADGLGKGVLPAVPPEEKRRKVVRSATIVGPSHPVAPRSRAPRVPISKLPQSQNASFLVPASKRSTARSRATASITQTKVMDGDDATASSSASSGVPPRMASKLVNSKTIPRKR